MSLFLPLNETTRIRQAFRIEGQLIPEGQPAPQIDFRIVSPAYFPTLGLPLLTGRLFSQADDEKAPAVAAVNRSMARHYWGEQDPIGRRVSLDDGESWVTVVGVVGDVKSQGLDREAPHALYQCFTQVPSVNQLFIRARVDLQLLRKRVTQAVYEIDPQQAVDRFQTLEQLRRDSLASPRLTTFLLGAFATLALVITAAGVSGVTALTTSQRTREIAIRMALGAERSGVLRMVMGQGLLLVLAGLGLGVAGALALTQLMRSLLFAVEPTDPLTYVGVSLVLMAVAAVACFAPARRAASIDPLAALRVE